MKKSSPKKRSANVDPITIEESSGNVFADLGLEDPEELLAKAALAHRIGAIIAQRKITQETAAQLLGIDQPKVSSLMRGKLDGFSIDRLFRFLNALGSDVDIIIRAPRPGEKANTRVLPA